MPENVHMLCTVKGQKVECNLYETPSVLLSLDGAAALTPILTKSADIVDIGADRVIGFAPETGGLFITPKRPEVEKKEFEAVE